MLSKCLVLNVIFSVLLNWINKGMLIIIKMNRNIWLSTREQASRWVSMNVLISPCSWPWCEAAGWSSCLDFPSWNKLLSHFRASCHCSRKATITGPHVYQVPLVLRLTWWGRSQWDDVTCWCHSGVWFQSLCCSWRWTRLLAFGVWLDF